MDQSIPREISSTKLTYEGKPRMLDLGTDLQCCPDTNQLHRMIYSQWRSNKSEFVGCIGNNASTSRLGSVTRHFGEEDESKRCGWHTSFSVNFHLSLILAWFECGGRSGFMSIASHINQFWLHVEESGS